LEYQYGSLQGLPTGTIRLLELLPGQVSEQIRCHLRIATVNDDFQALSYVWGTDPAIHPIEVENKLFYLRQNLFDGLIHVRNPIESQVFWADAICVNQEDSAERSSQVMLMSQIFGNATLVVAWLGTNPNYTDRLLRAPPVLVEHAAGSDTGHPNCVLQPSEPAYNMSELVTFLENEIPLLSHLISRPYWTRMWIVPEIVLARRLKLQYGQYRVTWDRLSSWWALIRTWDKEGFSARQATELSHYKLLMRLSALEHLENYREDYLRGESSKGATRQSFFDLITSNVFRQCTDPRDKIIPLLGLAWRLFGNGEETRVTLEYYKMSETQLYQHVIDICQISVTVDELLQLVRRASKVAESLLSEFTQLSTIKETTLIETRLTAEKARLTAEKARLDAELERLEVGTAPLKAESAKLKADVARLKADVALFEADVTRLEARVAGLKALSEAARDRLNSYIKAREVGEL
jgi:cell division protein FtsB